MLQAKPVQKLAFRVGCWYVSTSYHSVGMACFTGAASPAKLLVDVDLSSLIAPRAVTSPVSAAATLPVSRQLRPALNLQEPEPQ